MLLSTIRKKKIPVCQEESVEAERDFKQLELVIEGVKFKDGIEKNKTNRR